MWRPRGFGWWPIAEDVEHLVLAECDNNNRMWRAVEAHQRGEAPGDAPNKGLASEAIIKRTGKPRELALGGVAVGLPAFAGGVGARVGGAGFRGGRFSVLPVRFHMDRHVEQIERTRALLGKRE